MARPSECVLKTPVPYRKRVASGRAHELEGLGKGVSVGWGRRRRGGAFLLNLGWDPRDSFRGRFDLVGNDPGENFHVGPGSRGLWQCKSSEIASSTSSLLLYRDIWPEELLRHRGGFGVWTNLYTSRWGVIRAVREPKGGPLLEVFVEGPWKYI